MKKMMMFVSVLGFAFGMTACGGPDCVDLCEKGNECEGAEQTDCDEVCEQSEKLNDASDCGDKFDDMLSCMDDNSDKICEDDQTSCSVEGLAYFACVTEYCTENPTESACSM